MSKNKQIKILKSFTGMFFLFFTGLFFITSSLFAQNKVDLQDGLIGFYSFTDKGKDDSGNRYDAEIDGVNRERDVSGEKNGSYRWNDEDDNIKLPIDINIGTLPQVSLCAWVYPLSYSGKNIIISNDDRGGDRKLFSTFRNRKGIWACSDGKNGFIGKEPVIFRKWVFLVAVYNEKTKKASIYVDGVKTTGKTTMDMGADFTMIGANPCGNDEFEALIDEVRIYNRVLSEAEIDSLRNLKPIIDNFKKEKTAEDSAYYLVQQNNLIVRSQPTVKAKVVGKLKKSDTLCFDKAVPSKGGKWNEWLKINIKGKTGYVQLKYLEHRTVKKDNMSEYEKFMKENMNLGSWTFWIITVLLLIIGLFGTFKFGFIDEKLSILTGNYYGKEVSFFSMICGAAGVSMAVLMVFWQDTIEYYFGNFTLLPFGYGFITWLVLIIILAVAIAYIKLLIESFLCGSIVHGLLRIIIQTIIGIFTLFSVFVISVAIIVIMIIIFVGIMMLYAMLFRSPRRDKWGNRIR